MERVAFTLRLKPGCEHLYDQLHREMWPEMRDEIRACGQRNYTIFRSKTLVFGYVECHPDRSSLQGSLDDDLGERWQAVVEPWLAEPITFLDPVWHQD